MSDTSDGSVSQSSESSAQTQESRETVSYETHRRLLDEKKREQAARKQLESELEAFKAKERALEEEKLKQQGEYQKLLGFREEELKSFKDKVNQYESKFQRAEKMSAFIKAAGQDLDDKWLSLINVEAIQYRPDSEGEIDQMSVASAVETFKKTWPEAFKTRSTMMPADMPNGQGFITETEWKKMSKAEDRKKYKPNQILWGK